MIKGEMVHIQLAGVPQARHITVQECSLLMRQQFYYVCYVKLAERGSSTIYYLYIFNLCKITDSCVQYTVLTVCTNPFSSDSGIVLAYSLAQRKDYNINV